MMLGNMLDSSYGSSSCGTVSARSDSMGTAHRWSSGTSKSTVLMGAEGKLLSFLAFLPTVKICA